MIFFRLGQQRPPDPQRVNDDVVMRFEHVYEIAPEKMATFPQQHLPAWDTLRIVAARWDHLAWMHDHWADRVLSVAEFDSGESETLEDHS
ncbi:MAG TPA: hypothetical protein VFO78_03885 [Candidatus Limnocylindrales bacterium]|nr:hypothetical protein [Candidatus Limnocylindrales bacterium]